MRLGIGIHSQGVQGAIHQKIFYERSVEGLVAGRQFVDKHPFIRLGFGNVDINIGFLVVDSNSVDY